ncbi:MAG: hypothetical protein R3C28_28495 [Pirellulaceae bacterium]
MILTIGNTVFQYRRVVCFGGVITLLSALWTTNASAQATDLSDVELQDNVASNLDDIIGDDEPAIIKGRQPNLPRLELHIHLVSFGRTDRITFDIGGEQRITLSRQAGMDKAVVQIGSDQVQFHLPAPDDETLEVPTVHYLFKDPETGEWSNPETPNQAKVWPAKPKANQDRPAPLGGLN